MARARRMDGQMELFGGSAARPRPVVPASVPAPVAVSDLDDAALLAELPGAPLARAVALMGEVGMRRLPAAVPLLVTRARLLAHHPASGTGPAGRDLLAAFEALGHIGGPVAATALRDLVSGGGYAGPALLAALSAAARLAVRLERPVLLRLLADGHPPVRAAACRLAWGLDGPVVAALEQARLDPEPVVADAATCALGRLGRPGVRDALHALAARAPTPEVVAGLAGILDHDGMVWLGRLAQRADLRDAVLAALDGVEDNAAAALAARLRRGDAG